MKKIYLLLIMQIGVFAVYAQKHEPVKGYEPANPKKDKVEFQGYTIRIIPAEMGSYGYAIFKGKQLVVHQSYNPFTMSPLALDSKDDAYKVAKWEIKQLKKQEEEEKQIDKPGKPQRKIPEHKNTPPGMDLPPSLLNRLPQTKTKFNQPLSKDVARELQIDINKPRKN